MKKLKAASMPAPANSAGKEKAGLPTRSQPSEREAQIIRESIRFFAEHGFSGSTRELAKVIGITQPLLFRYFKSKDDLIERIYQTVFVDHWNQEWEKIILDRSLSLRERLIDFYQSYIATTFNYEWMRLYVFAGLANVVINRRYVEFFESKILKPLCSELRVECRMIPPDLLPTSRQELDYLWSFHGGIFYHGVRGCAFGTTSAHDISQVVVADIDAFLEGAPRALAKLMPPTVAKGRVK